MFGGPCKPIESPHEHRIKMLTLCVPHEPVEFRPPFLGSAPSPVGIFINDLRLSLFGPGPQRLELRFHVLAVLLRGDAGVEREAHFISRAWHS